MAIWVLAVLVTKAVSSTATAVGITPNTNWDGNDGLWSSFTIQIGTPPQAVRVFPSTSGSSVWAVVPQGCTTTDPSDCPNLRGGLFDPTISSTWVEKSIYNLPLTTEEVWGYSGNGQFGLDNITLSYSGGQGPLLNNTMLAGIATKDFFIGTLGLTPWGVNFTDFNQPAPSVLTLLKNAGDIDSNSWGYTAGAYYTPKQTYGSLTFGGYDRSRFVPNNLSITRGPDISHDLLLGIQSITSATENLLPHGIIALIDSTVPQIWLPLEACQRFEEVFGLEWDENLQLYPVNDSLHETLLNQDPNVTFTIGSTTTSSEIVNINMPYGSFDLTATWPLTANGTSRYFPLRRAENASQYVLGRTFLQQAYLIVDYDRNSFSVSQALFPDTNVPQELVAILPPSKQGSSHSMSTAAIAGIAVGAVAGVIILLGIAFFTRRKWWRKTPKRSDEHHEPDFVKPELDSTTLNVKNGDLDPAAHSNGEFYNGDIERERGSARHKGLAEAGCNDILIPELHAPDKMQHEVMGDVRPAAELSVPRVAAELSSDLSRTGVHRTRDSRYELP